MQPTTMLVQAIKHKDVRGKELLYLKIQHEGNEVLVNIGERTYKAVVELVNQQQLKLHAEEPITKIQFEEPEHKFPKPEDARVNTVLNRLNK